MPDLSTAFAKNTAYRFKGGIFHYGFKMLGGIYSEKCGMSYSFGIFGYFRIKKFKGFGFRRIGVYGENKIAAAAEKGVF